MYVCMSLTGLSKVRNGNKWKIARKPSEPADGYGLSSGATLRVQLPSEAVLSPSLVRAYPFCPY